MAITLEELQVILTSNSKQLRSDFKKTQKLGQQLKNKLGKALNSIPFGGAIKGAFSMKGAFAAVAGVAGIGLLIKKTAEAADEIAKMSKNLGVTSSFLQGLGFAATQSGVPVAALNTSLLKFNRAIGEAAAGEKTFKDLFDAVGVSVTDANGKIKDSEVLFLEVSDGVAQLGSKSEQAAVLMELFGRAGGKMINLMAGGSGVINKFRKEAEELGLILDDELLEGAEKITDQFDIMQRALSTQVSAAVLSLAPEIQSLTGALIEGAKATAEFIKGFRIITTASRIFSGETKGLSQRQAFLIQKETELLANRKKLTDAIKVQGKSVADSSIDASRRIEALNIQLGNTRTEIRRVTEKFKEQAGAVREVTGANAENLQQAKKLIEIQAKAQELVTKGGETPESKAQDELKILKEASDSKLAIEGDLQSALASKRAEVEEIKQEKLEEEIEILRERNDLLAELGTDAADLEIETNNRVIEDRKKGIKDGTDFSISEKIREQKANDKIQKFTIKSTGAFFGDLMTLTKGNSETLFAIAKAGAIATASVDGIVAIQKAAAAAPFPANIPGIIIETARKAVNVSRIAGTSFQKGIDKLPGIGNQDSIPILAGPGEGIINRRGNEKLETFLDAQLGPSGVAPGGDTGPARIVISFDTDRLVDFVEARLDERGVLGTALEVKSA